VSEPPDPVVTAVKELADRYGLSRLLHAVHILVLLRLRDARPDNPRRTDGR
jgi:hypothetical protein